MRVRVIRSKKRKKTVSGRLEDGVVVVRAPAKLSDAELRPILTKLVAKVERAEAKKRLDDGALERLARELNRRYFDGRLRWQSIRWVTNQNTRFGSCTAGKGTIRISHRVANMPTFVRDYVIVHELAHLKHANHSGAFWDLVSRYPRTERARGYLMAVGLERLEV